MSKQYDNNMRGVLFKNDKKETEKHPDYTGSATIENVDYFMDAWLNEAESGRKYMSFSFKAKTKQSAAPASKTPARRGRDEDEAPF